MTIPASDGAGPLAGLKVLDLTCLLPGSVFASRPLAHWSASFVTVDCGVTPVLTFVEAMAHPQLKARGRLQEIGGLPQFPSPLK